MTVWFRLAGLMVVVAIGGTLLGFAASRKEVRRLESQGVVLEQSNRALRRTLDSWPQGVRSARAPLEERIRVLEQQLASSRLETSRLETNRVDARSIAPVVSAAPTAAVAKAPNIAEELAKRPMPEVLAAPPSVALEPVLPAVSTSPPASGPADCNILISPGFDLSTGDEGVARFGGMLRLALTDDEHGRNLHVAGDELSPYPVEALPAHVAWECEGLPYIVSLCEGNGSSFRGQVSIAGAFGDACGRESPGPQ